MEKYPKIGVNVFVIKDKKVLLGKRIGIGQGTWCLPGGHLEWGESLKDGAMRELEEETGIQCNDLEFLHVVNDPLKETHYIHIDFFAKEWTGMPKVMEPDKCAEWGWFDIDNLPDPIFIGHQKLFPAFKNQIKFVD